ncbi:MAG: DUF3891 family protein [Firmicutes bacterium]|nr:DUF3891 family protein [Bacillota bacterium]
MLVRRDGDSLLLITQADHGRLAGEMAAAWGAAPWSRPEPYEAVCLATALHDDGWEAADARPALDPESGGPRPFWALPYRERAAFYREGIAAVAEQNAYAGLLVSMHLAALWDGYGIRPATGLGALPEEEAQAVVAFLNGEAARQAALRAQAIQRLRQEKEVRRFQRRLQVNLRWLALWDWLSLLLCLDADPADSLDGSGVVPSALSTGVPLGYWGDRRVDLVVRRLGPGRFALDPYPFVREPLYLTVPARRVPARRYRSEEEWLAAFREAKVERLPFVIMALR